MKASKLDGKKVYFLIFVLLPVVFTVCSDPLPVDEDLFEPPPVDVVYSNDWRYITVYLYDDRIAVSTNNVTRPYAQEAPVSNRAMTRDTAQFAFDFFEAVFCYTEADGTKRVARSSWEIGNRAEVKYVYRGVDYSAAAPEPGKGAALLLAGRKIAREQNFDDYGPVADIQPTVLGVGLIYSVDDVPGAVITEESSYVTFELSAITGGVNADTSVSSFKTAYFGSEAKPENTYVVNAKITNITYTVVENGEIKRMPRLFPLFVLPGGRNSVAAQYQFGVDPFNNRKWDDYGGGIIIAEPSAGEDLYSAITREVRSPAGNDRYWYPIYKVDRTTKVRMENNKNTGGRVNNPVEFRFDTSNTNNVNNETENGIFTLVFRIPVYAVTGQAGTGGIEAKRWYLEPGYQSYKYNIDNGVDSTGGGVLMGVEAPPDFEVSAIRR